jgi:general secretion pathway protein A
VLWGVIFDNPEIHPCTLALSIDLKCFTNTGSLEDLVKLDRPAVISVRQQWMTLSKFGEGVATLITGDRQFEVSAQDLARNWNGKYTIFWRTPPGYERPLTLGDVGLSVNWLATQLAVMESSPPVLSTEIKFNEVLEDRLKQFQISVSIIPDGVAGVRTWIHVNSILGAGIPFLKQEEG